MPRGILRFGSLTYPSPIRRPMYARTAVPHSRPIQGFTLIEILVVIGMIAILATVVLVAINPLRQFAQARNTQRQANVSAILNAIGERIADNGGTFAGGTCPALPSEVTAMSKNAFDIRSCIVPTYISELPYDPSNGNNGCLSDTCMSQTYDTGYTVAQNAATSRITVCAPSAQENALAGSQPFCLTR